MPAAKLMFFLYLVSICFALIKCQDWKNGLCDVVNEEKLYAGDELKNIMLPTDMPKTLRLAKHDQDLIWILDGSQIVKSQETCQNNVPDCKINSVQLEMLEIKQAAQLANPLSILADSNVIVKITPSPTDISLCTIELGSIIKTRCEIITSNNDMEISVEQKPSSLRITRVGKAGSMTLIERENVFMLNLRGNYQIQGNIHRLLFKLHKCPKKTDDACKTMYAGHSFDLSDDTNHNGLQNIKLQKTHKGLVELVVDGSSLFNKINDNGLFYQAMDRRTVDAIKNVAQKYPKTFLQKMNSQWTLDCGSEMCWESLCGLSIDKGLLIETCLDAQKFKKLSKNPKIIKLMQKETSLQVEERYENEIVTNLMSLNFYVINITFAQKPNNIQGSGVHQLTLLLDNCGIETEPDCNDYEYPCCRKRDDLIEYNTKATPLKKFWDFTVLCDNYDGPSTLNIINAKGDKITNLKTRKCYKHISARWVANMKHTIQGGNINYQFFNDEEVKNIGLMSYRVPHLTCNPNMVIHLKDVKTAKITVVDIEMGKLETFDVENKQNVEIWQQNGGVDIFVWDQEENKSQQTRFSHVLVKIDATATFGENNKIKSDNDYIILTKPLQSCKRD